MHIEMDTITMSKAEFDYWKTSNSVYLKFDYTQRKHYVLYDFNELNEGYKLIQEHYNSQDEYQEAIWESDRFLHDEGFYLYDDDCEENDDVNIPTWSYTTVGEYVVVTRAYLWR